MAGRRKATIAAAMAATLAMIAVPTWTDAARKQHHGGGGNPHRTGRNVIVLQGDGMATPQRDLIRLVSNGNKAGDELIMNSLDHAGLVPILPTGRSR